MNGQPEPRRDAADTAWRIHTALMDWTGKVDTKASFALSLESAAVTALAAFSGDVVDASFGRGRWAVVALYWTGVGLLMAAIVMAVVVVMPRLDGAAAKADPRAGFVYFGHLRHWAPAQLTEALRGQDPVPVLCRQVIDMSRISWRKHRLVQMSLVAATAGAATACTARIIG
ncbi:hypothetical protein FCH28_36005 [Streptomyces piniterrae]|uniref:Pycsar effector protein domain-containing protein n=2 Tax=Streptomyces piniterrae TaxID=2571125 RepID=A0A4U0MNB3_9ACTN|nr:hypothetical protein FCH28_36005 [Streptomyces piniterrae]